MFVELALASLSLSLTLPTSRNFKERTIMHRGASKGIYKIRISWFVSKSRKRLGGRKDTKHKEESQLKESEGKQQVLFVERAYFFSLSFYNQINTVYVFIFVEPNTSLFFHLCLIEGIRD